MQELDPVLAGMDVGRRIRQDGQGRRFSPGKLCRRPSEIAPGSCFKPHYVPTERGMRSVHADDLFLRASQLETGGEDGFDQFLAEIPVLAPRHPDYLHGNRATSACDMACLDVTYGSPDYGKRIDTMVEQEPPVLEHDQGGTELFGNAV